MRYGFIGAGVIASAIMRGMAKSGITAIAAYDTDSAKTAALAKAIGITEAHSAAALVEQADAVILAVKPGKVAEVLLAASDALGKHKPLIISVAAGKALRFLNGHAPSLPICRAMPNVNAAVGESMTLLCYNEHVTDEHKAAACRAFEAVGRVHEADERLFPALSALCGCSPAFTYSYIESLAKAAHKAGVDKQTAIKLAAQAVLGSAKRVLESDEHPAALADGVCSPGGTTIEGVCALDRHGFAAAVCAAVDAAIDKDGRL